MISAGPTSQASEPSQRTSIGPAGVRTVTGLFDQAAHDGGHRRARRSGAGTHGFAAAALEELHINRMLINWYDK